MGVSVGFLGFLQSVGSFPDRATKHRIGAFRGLVCAFLKAGNCRRAGSTHHLEGWVVVKGPDPLTTFAATLAAPSFASLVLAHRFPEGLRCAPETTVSPTFGSSLTLVKPRQDFDTFGSTSLHLSSSCYGGELSVSTPWGYALASQIPFQFPWLLLHFASDQSWNYRTLA